MAGRGISPESKAGKPGPASKEELRERFIDQEGRAPADGSALVVTPGGRVEEMVEATEDADPGAQEQNPAVMSGGPRASRAQVADAEESAARDIRGGGDRIGRPGLETGDDNGPAGGVTEAPEVGPDADGFDHGSPAYGSHDRQGGEGGLEELFGEGSASDASDDLDALDDLYGEPDIDDLHGPSLGPDIGLDDLVGGDLYDSGRPDPEVPGADRVSPDDGSGVTGTDLVGQKGGHANNPYFVDRVNQITDSDMSHEEKQAALDKLAEAVHETYGNGGEDSKEIDTGSYKITYSEGEGVKATELQKAVAKEYEGSVLEKFLHLFTSAGGHTEGGRQLRKAMEGLDDVEGVDSPPNEDQPSSEDVSPEEGYDYGNPLDDSEQVQHYLESKLGQDDDIDHGDDFDEVNAGSLSDWGDGVGIRADYGPDGGPLEPSGPGQDPTADDGVTDPVEF